MNPETDPADDAIVERPTRRIVAHTSLYSGATLLSQLLALLRGAVIAGSLGPALFGTWTALAYIVAFSPYSNLGIFTGMAREYSFHVGKKRPDVAAEFKDSAFSFGMTTAAIVAAGLVAIALLAESLPLVARVGLGAMAANTFIDRYFYFQVAVFRQEKMIVPLSGALVLSAVLYTVCVIPLIGAWGIYILFLALPLSNVPSIAFLLTRTAKHFHWRWDKQKIRAMIRLGLPIDSIGLVETLTNTIGGIVALVFLSTRDLGFFGVGMTGVFFLLQIPMAIAFITYPYLVEEYGRTENVHQMDWYSVNLTRFIALVMPLIVGVSIISLPVLVRHALPAFGPGVPAIRLLLIGGFFFSLHFVTANFLVAMKKQDRYAIMRVLTAVLNVALIFVFLTLGFELEGIAAAYAITGLVLATAMISTMLHFFVPSWIRIAWFLVKTYAPIAYALASISLVTFLSTPAASLSHDLRQLGMQIAGLAVLYIPVLYVGGRRTGLTRLLAARIRTMRGQGE